MRNLKVVYYVNRSGDIVLNPGLHRRHYNRQTGITRNRAMRVTQAGRDYLAAMRYEKWKDSDNG